MSDNGCFSTGFSNQIRKHPNEKTLKCHDTKKAPHQLKKAKARKEKQRQEKAAIAEQKGKQTDLIYQIHSTIHHHFPGLFNLMREIDDVRTRTPEYELSAIITACIAMFLFKTESRNGYNNKRENLQFCKNYEKLFGFSMPHGDTVHNVIELLDEEQIEQLNLAMVRTLLKRKIFHKSRYREHWFRVAVDASGLFSCKDKHCEQCLHSTSKRGKITYFHNVLNARLITPNGFSISLASEWIENPIDGNYDKQDCERKAFKRLAKKLKKMYPKLPIIILVDGLYPYQGFFDICEANQWAYCGTFKDGNLPSVWEETNELKALQADNRHQEIRYGTDKENTKIVQLFCWVEGIDYKGHTLNWLECVETKTWTNNEGITEEKTTRFVHITDLPVDRNNVADTSHTGRLRWKIENEGFNTLKNGGYGMKHKWARKSYQALKNYFQFMQIGHLINQLMVKNTHFQKAYLQGKNHPTLKGIWEDLIAAMKWAEIQVSRLKEILATRIQCRFVT